MMSWGNSKRKERSRVNTSWLPFIAAAALVFVGLFLLRKGRPIPAETYAYARTTSGSMPKLWQVPAFSFTDQRGEVLTATTLLGRPWIADFIFTECTSACPLMTARMVMLQRSLVDVDVRFVSLSVDPEHDTPATLATYAGTWNAAETRWELLATDRARLADALDGFHVTANGEGGGIVHSSVFLLVDATGWVRGVYETDDRGAREALASDVRKLKPTPVGATTKISTAPLLTSLGCAGCHSRPSVAPLLGGTAGTERTLRTGTKVRADDTYLRRSILEPGQDVVAGYSAMMPSYEGQVSEAQLAALLEELKAMPADSTPTPPIAPELVVDPVCHMSVRVEAGTPHARFEGREVYFCSESCRASFVANPGKFR